MTEPAIPRSGRTGVRWPAIPRGREAVMLALQYQLDDSQWWPPATLLAHQLAQAEIVLAHAARTVPFYRERLRVLAGLRPGALTMEAFRRIPVLTRSDIQDAGDALITRRLPKDHAPANDASTSGSTGKPITVKVTPVTGLFFSALNLRYHLWHGRRIAGHAAAIRSLRGSMAEAAERGATVPWVPGYPSGPMSVLSIATPVDRQVDWLLEKDPEYLLTMPSNLRALIERFAEKGLRPPPKLVEITTMAENLDPEVRELCREAWNIPLNDIYSCQESGMLALQCPGHPTYHVQDESVILEVLDDDGRPCEPGRVGRVVFTDLHNFATPLIRYEIGDYAEAGGPCPCGRGLSVLNRVVGRGRNMLVLPSGDRVFPMLPSKPLATIAPIRQMQVIQHTVGAIEVKLVMPRPLTADEDAALRAYFTASFIHEFDLTFTYVDEIPRTPGGKYEQVVSRVPPPAAS